MTATHIADVAALDAAASRTREAIRDDVCDLLGNIHHAIDNAHADTVHDLVDSFALRMVRAARDIDDAQPYYINRRPILPAYHR